MLWIFKKKAVDLKDLVKKKKSEILDKPGSQLEQVVPAII